METVPAYLVTLALAEIDEELRELLKPCGKMLGNKVELDLKEVDAFRPDIANVLRAYKKMCTSFWEARENKSGGGHCVMVKRKIYFAAQRNTKTEKKDLTEQLLALEGIPGLFELMEEVTAPCPDWEKVMLLGKPFSLSVLKDEAWANVQLLVEGDLEWPMALGGAASAGEVRRELSLRIGYAPWRDRRNRRLVEVEVVAQEVWPAPAHMRML